MFELLLKVNTVRRGDTEIALSLHRGCPQGKELLGIVVGRRGCCFR